MGIGFPYLAKQFKLNIVSVIEREPGTEPTPQELEDTIKKVKALGTKVLFTEPQYSPAAAETIARETGAKIYQLDPVVTGEANEEAIDAYINTMKKNMAVLKEALQWFMADLSIWQVSFSLPKVKKTNIIR